ncbi:hypothetical protein [Streptomyces sp. NPDC014622]|uniref:hypothetical protein n=1 Tax=Streptomyces sp. NPDC014622 TaxID=3364874 RepID=UPI0036F6B461
MNLQEHAKAIEAAIMAAHRDGYELDNGDAVPIHEMGLNSVEDGWFGDWVSISLPAPTYY